MLYFESCNRYSPLQISDDIGFDDAKTGMVGVMCMIYIFKFVIINKYTFIRNAILWDPSCRLNGV